MTACRLPIHADSPGCARGGDQWEPRRTHAQAQAEREIAGLHKKTQRSSGSGCGGGHRAPLHEPRIHQDGRHEAHRPQDHHDLGCWTYCDWPGVRVRLLWYPGMQGSQVCATTPLSPNFSAVTVCSRLGAKFDLFETGSCKQDSTVGPFPYANHSR